MTEPLVKRCENCKRLFGPRKMPNGTFEYPSIFKTKRYCSRVCAGVAVEADKKVAKDIEAHR